MAKEAPHDKAIEERLLGQPIVGALVLRRNAPLVAPPHLDPAPVRLQLRRQLVGAARCPSSGQHDVSTGPGRPGQPRGHNASGSLYIGLDDELDVYAAALDAGAGTSPRP